MIAAISSFKPEVLFVGMQHQNKKNGSMQIKIKLMLMLFV